MALDFTCFPFFLLRRNLTVTILYILQVWLQHHLVVRWCQNIESDTYCKANLYGPIHSKIISIDSNIRTLNMLVKRMHPSLHHRQALSIVSQNILPKRKDNHLMKELPLDQTYWCKNAFNLFRQSCHSGEKEALSKSKLHLWTNMESIQIWFTHNINNSTSWSCQQIHFCEASSWICSITHPRHGGSCPNTKIFGFPP